MKKLLFFVITVFLFSQNTQNNITSALITLNNPYFTKYYQEKTFYLELKNIDNLAKLFYKSKVFRNVTRLVEMGEKIDTMHWIKLIRKTLEGMNPYYSDDLLNNALDYPFGYIDKYENKGGGILAYLKDEVDNLKVYINMKYANLPDKNFENSGFMQKVQEIKNQVNYINHHKHKNLTPHLKIIFKDYIVLLKSIENSPVNVKITKPMIEKYYLDKNGLNFDTKIIFHLIIYGYKKYNLCGLECIYKKYYENAGELKYF